MARADSCEELPLSKAAEFLLDECRTVLPGIQALFGFQLIAVFNEAFGRKLDSSGQQLHLLAIVLVAIAIAIIMTPAALHRQKGEMTVTRRFVDVSTRLLLWSMAPLALGICVEFYLVATIITPAGWVLYAASALFALYSLLWFVLPRVERLQKLIAQ